jgi:FKBP-type peptidyl-prolyl cis-trans isomerase 2
LFHEVGKEQLPQEMQIEVGMGLVSKAPDGSEKQLTVAEVKVQTIIVDANHPLAGKDLIFEVEVLEIK